LPIKTSDYKKKPESTKMQILHSSHTNHCKEALCHIAHNYILITCAVVLQSIYAVCRHESSIIIHEQPSELTRKVKQGGGNSLLLSQ